MPRALAKAERYRLLNEPGEAESICLDVLEIEPDNQEALATLLLALTDQFDDDTTVASPKRGRRSSGCATTTSARTTPASSTSGGPRRCSRHGTPGCGPRAYEWLREAMTWYEKAEAIRPPNNDDALLRWNACARLIMRDHHLVPIARRARRAAVAGIVSLPGHR